MRSSDRSVIQPPAPTTSPTNPQETQVYFSAQNEVSPLGQQFIVVSELVVDESRDSAHIFLHLTQGHGHCGERTAAVPFIRPLRETNQLAILSCLVEQCVHARLTIFIYSHIRPGTPAGSVADCYCISFRYNGSRLFSRVCVCARLCVFVSRCLLESAS